MRTRDAHLWEEEVVEIFLDAEGAGVNYAELEINPANVVCDLRVERPAPAVSSDTRWDWAGLESAVVPLADTHGTREGWTAVARLPWDGLRSLSRRRRRRSRLHGPETPGGSTCSESSGPGVPGTRRKARSSPPGPCQTGPASTCRRRSGRSASPETPGNHRFRGAGLQACDRAGLSLPTLRGSRAKGLEPRQFCYTGILFWTRRSSP